MSTTDQFDPFKTDTGLKDDFDGTIVDAWFGTDPNNSDNKSLMAYFKINASDGEEVEPRYSTGTGWSSFDGGITAEHEKDNERRRGFNNRCAYAEMYTAAMAVGGEAEMRRRSAEELNNNGPRDMRLWKGLSFHWEIKTEEFTLREGTPEERKVTSNRLIPTAFLGVAGGAISTNVGATTSTVAPSAAPQPTAGLQPQASPPQPSPGSPTSSGTPIAQPGPIQQPGALITPQNMQQTAPMPPTEQQPAQTTPVQAPVQAAQPAAEAPTTAADPNTPDWSFWSQLSPELQQGIATNAKQLAYPQFVDAVLALPGAVENGKLVMALGDENLYQALRNQ